jgi:hypothetical protein
MFGSRAEIPKVAELWRMKTDAELAAVPDWKTRMHWCERHGLCYALALALAFALAFAALAM